MMLSDWQLSKVDCCRAHTCKIGRILAPSGHELTALGASRHMQVSLYGDHAHAYDPVGRLKADLAVTDRIKLAMNPP